MTATDQIQEIIPIWALIAASLLCMAISTPHDLIGQTFPCDGSLYYVSTSLNGGSDLFQIDIKSSRDLKYQKLPLNNANARHITCLGYNVKDQKLYGLDFNTYELLQITSDGEIRSLGVPENLDTTFQYFAGGMTPDGRRLVVIARNRKSDLDERIYSIRINDAPTHYAGYFSIIADVPVSMTDIAVDPLIGVTYGYDVKNGQIVETDRTGLTSSNHRNFEKGSQDFGTLFFDRNGQMFALGSAGRGGTHNVFYEIDKRNGHVQQLQTLKGGFDSDGCSCPYTIEFFKSIDPPELIGCGIVTIDYNVINKAGIGQVGLRLEDHLPPEFSIIDVQMENIFLVDINSGVNSNLLDIDEWTLVLGENRIKVLAEIETMPADETLGSQAELLGLSEALTQHRYSDDPRTGVLDDATQLRILAPDELVLEDYISSSCDLETFIVSIPIEGEFEWSDGATDAKWTTVQPGSYGVTVTNKCFTWSESFTLEASHDALRVQLGDDLSMRLGDEPTLSFETNARSIEEMVWSTIGDLHLDCRDCLQPGLIAVGDGHVHLTITDERGCVASDTIMVTVDREKRIYAPSAFTPNDDGLNDVFGLYGNTGQIEQFSIADRWGNLVFSASDITITNNGAMWDGKSTTAHHSSSGIYIWYAIVAFPDGTREKYSGDVILIR